MVEDWRKEEEGEEEEEEEEEEVEDSTRERLSIQGTVPQTLKMSLADFSCFCLSRI